MNLKMVTYELDDTQFLVDAETDEEIDTVNPGKQGQTVRMKLPIKCEIEWILRRKK